MKTTFKRVLGIILALCVLVAGATCLMGTSVFAEEPTNVAKLSNENDVSQQARVLYSAQNTNAYNAFDGKVTNDNANQWYVASTTGYIIIDLGAIYDLSRIDVYARYTASGTRTYTYDIYTTAYLAGVNYVQSNHAAVAAALRAENKIVSGARNAKNLSHDIAEGTYGRYVMLDITKSEGGDINVAEMEVYALPYTPDNQTKSNGGAPAANRNIAYTYLQSLASNAARNAKAVAKNSASNAYKAFDGVVANNGNANQYYPGSGFPQYLVVDLGAVYNLSAITISFRNKAEAYREYSYQLYAASELSVELNSTNLDTIRTEMMATPALANIRVDRMGTHAFATPKVGRYVLLNVSDGGGDTNLFEFEIFGYNITSSFAIDEANKTITIPEGLGITAQDLINSITVNGNAYASIDKAGNEVITKGDYLVINHTAEAFATDITTVFPGATAYKIAVVDDNLAAGATNVLESGHESSCAATNAFDGNISNSNADKWMVTRSATYTPWLVVDLGKNYTLQAAQSYIYGSTTDAQARQYYYNLYVADADDFDGEFNEENKAEVAAGIMANGTKVATVDASNAGYGGTYSTFNANGRYVLLEYTGGNASATMSFYELELFGYVFEADELEVNDTKNTISVPYAWGKNVTTDKILSDLTIDKAMATFNDNATELTLTFSKGKDVATKTYTIAYPNFTGIGQSIIAGLSTQDEKMNVVLGSAAGYNAPAYPFKILDGVAVDANNNKWFSNNSPSDAVPHYVIVDLGKAYNITGLNLALSAVRDHTYTIHTIADLGDVAFTRENAAAVQQKIINDGTLIVSQTTNKGTKDFTVDNAFGRYVLVNITKCVEGTTAKSTTILEFEVYGYAVTSNDAAVVVDNVNKTITIPFAWGKEATDANIANALTFSGNAVFEVKDGKVIINTMNSETVEYVVNVEAADGSHVNKTNGTVGFYTADNALVQVNPGDEVSVSFEYYTTGSMVYRLQFKNGDNVVFNGLGLPTGRNKFEQTVTVPAEGGVLTPYIVRGSSANIYVWNIKVVVNGEDVNVAYAKSSNATGYFTKEAVSEELGLNLDKDHFVTKVDLTDIDASKVDRDIWVGINFGANSNFPAYATDKITFAYDYFLSGNATTVQVSSTAAATAIGNAVGMYDKTNGVVVGAGHMAGVVEQTSTSQWGDSIRAAASVAIRKNSEVYPDYFYVWNLQLGTPNHGTITYLENSAFEVKVYNDYSNQYPNRNVVTLDGVNPTAELVAVDKGEELAYIYADTDDVVMDDLNGDGVINICDSVFLHASATFKDIRAFDKDYNDELKSAADYLYIRNQIWGNK